MNTIKGLCLSCLLAITTAQAQVRTILDFTTNESKTQVITIFDFTTNEWKAQIYQGREQRDALVDAETMRKLRAIELDLMRPGWAAEKLDQEASALWLSQRVDHSKAEIDRNFAKITREYFGRVITPTGVYDEIVKHELATAQKALQPASQPKQAAQAQGESEATDKKEVKSWQFARTFAAEFAKAGHDVAAGTFSIIEGALNSMGGTPERVTMDEIHRSNISALSGLEYRGLGNTPEAQRLRSIVEAKARDWDQDFLARKAEWENSTVRGALSSTAREHADFFFELGKESYDCYGSALAYRRFTSGFEQVGGLVAAWFGMVGGVWLIGRILIRRIATSSLGRSISTMATAMAATMATRATREKLAKLKFDAHRGNPSAQLSLGEMYLSGRDGVKDEPMAARLFIEAAEHGNLRAQFLAGRCYLLGQGVPRDTAQAHAYFELAASAGHLESVSARDDVAGTLNNDERMESIRVSRGLFERIRKAPLRL